VVRFPKLGVTCFVSSFVSTRSCLMHFKPSRSIGPRAFTAFQGAFSNAIAAAFTVTGRLGLPSYQLKRSRTTNSLR